MVYFAPFIDDAGIHIPTYLDNENYLISQAQTIFGSDIVLDSSSQDFQHIAMLANLISQTQQALVLNYNNLSPVSAIDGALDRAVSYNGLIRNASSFSTCPVTLAGTPFATVVNGVVGDIFNNPWSLPASVQIGAGGTVNTTATCQVLGSITVGANQITAILTPTFGWTGVTNGSNLPSVGLPVETNGQLRTRQSISVSNPSQAITTGILGAVLALPGVKNAQLYENDSSSIIFSINGVNNPGGYPANSMTLVVTGGDPVQIATAYAVRKTNGCYTNGTTSEVIADIFGVENTIRFYVPTPQSLDISFIIKVFSGYNTTIGNNAISNIVNYVNAMIPGQTVVVSALEQAAMSANPKIQTPVFSITSFTVGNHGGSLGSVDMPMDFNINATTITAQVLLTTS